MGLSEDKMEFNINRIMAVPTKYCPDSYKELLVDGVVNPFYKNGKHWNEEALRKLSDKQFDELYDLMKEEWLDENYKEVEEMYQEDLIDSGRYSPTLVRLGEVTDGRDDFVTEQFEQDIRENHAKGMQEMKDHLSIDPTN